ncbi:MAG: SAM-dependent methyltransferase [Candidatus Pacebacteria bacterium]|nr:SAM-dependent methyltransferase [Candidatus Paceibacterota bacterium]
MTIHEPADVIPFLKRCGYSPRNIRRDYSFGDSAPVPVAAFAHEPCDARTACIAVTAGGNDPEATVADLRKLGAPVVFVVGHQEFQWWQPGAETDKLRHSYASAQAVKELDVHRDKLGPEQLFRAKNFGRQHPSYQLEFVDLGLLPFAENQMGDTLSSLIEDVIQSVWRQLPTQKDEGAKSRQFRSLFETLFHVLAGKILHDKEVSGFKQLDTSDAFQTIQRVRRHYGQNRSPLGVGRLPQEVLVELAHRISQLSSLSNLTTETLGAVYEKTLVSKQNRKLLGIHSTPSYLIDYIVWDLVDWIAEIPADRRHVYEPCCGHAGFLVGAMRMLRDLLLGETPSIDVTEHDYLREHLHGLELDPFAMEIARLGLTLADVPNPNGWNLRRDNVFAAQWPGPRDPVPGIVFMNPPFENFKKQDRAELANASLEYRNKAAEIFSRLVRRLQPGGVFGVVLPETLLHNKETASLRERLCTEFELREITLFPDKVFNFSDAESAVLLGRRKKPKANTVRVNRVDNRDLDSFRKHQAPSDRQECSQQRFREQPGFDLRIPRLDAVWQELEYKPRLKSIVEGGQGLTYVAEKELPAKAHAVADHPFEGAVPGFTNPGRNVMLHQLPREHRMSLDPELIAAPRWGTAIGQPQVLLNYAPVRRGPWRLKALIDREGHAVTSRFLVFRPTDKRIPLDFIWALLNSPVGNAFAYCHLGKRDNLSGTMLNMPVPRITEEAMAAVTWKVCEYFEAAAGRANSLRAESEPKQLQDLLLRIDAEILRLYNLPPRLERQVLDLFRGHERVGVPFVFTEYFPPDFGPFIPLHEYLSPDYKRATAGELRKRLRSFDDPDISKALQIACEAFTLDEENQS